MNVTFILKLQENQTLQKFKININSHFIRKNFDSSLLLLQKAFVKPFTCFLLRNIRIIMQFIRKSFQIFRRFSRPTFTVSLLMRSARLKHAGSTRKSSLSPRSIQLWQSKTSRSKFKVAWYTFPGSSSETPTSFRT